MGPRAGANVFEYVDNSPQTRIDPSGMNPTYAHVYNCKQTQEIIQWAREATQAPWPEALWRGFQHHNEMGQFDFKINEPRATFVMNGDTLKAEEFGNFLAGYTGQKLVPVGIGGVRAGGIIIDYRASRAANKPFDWDMDSVPAIVAGAAYAKQEAKGSGPHPCGCP